MLLIYVIYLLMLRIYWSHDNCSLEKNSTRSRAFLFAKIIKTLLIIIIHALSLKNSMIIISWSCQNRLFTALCHLYHRLHRHSSWLNFLKILLFFWNRFLKSENDFCSWEFFSFSLKIYNYSWLKSSMNLSESKSSMISCLLITWFLLFSESLVLD